MKTLRSAILFALVAASTNLCAEPAVPAADPGQASAAGAAVPATPMQGPGANSRPSFEDIDADHDGRVTEQELDAYRTARMTQRAAEGRPSANARKAARFAEMDTNGDGAISSEEFENHRRQTREQRMQERGTRSGRQGAIPFGLMDTNRDGAVTLEEYDDFVSKQGRQAPQSGANGPSGSTSFSLPPFTELDANGDGKIERQESLGRGNAPAKPWRGLVLMDQNKDGIVDREEWEKFQAERASNGRSGGASLSFDDIDANGDGQLTWEEIMAKRKSRQMAPPAQRGTQNAPPSNGPMGVAPAPATVSGENASQQ